MRTFATYIEYLLMTRHYCYVPGVGAYMLSDEAASPGTVPGIGADSHRMHRLESPRRVVRFSPLHTHDDGILANLLMEAEGMTYDEACRYIQIQASRLPDDFADRASLATDTDNFGFDTLQVETWADIDARLHPTIQPEVTTSPRIEIRRDTVSIPMQMIRRAAVCLLIALFFFTNFIGLNTGDSQLAAMLDLSLLQRSVLVHQSWADEDEDYVADLYDQDSEAEYTAFEEADEAEDSQDATEHEECFETTAPTEALAVTESPEPTVATAKTAKVAEPAPTVKASAASYYIIIASTIDEAYAQKVCERYHRQGFEHVGVLARDGKFRLFIGCYNDRNEATQNLRSIRQQSEKLSKAWLLTVEEGSLSYIIKDIYNDNQLSMELSHLNRRPERDQG